MNRLRLVLFDVDGTLVDSQADIVSSMGAAFAAEGLTPPSREDTLSIVGLSLPVAMERLLPGVEPARRDRMVEAYKDTYVALRQAAPVEVTSPLYPGIREVLDALSADPWTLIGVATGKSLRGLTKLIEGHGLDQYFVTRQVADHHPSKPHPSMVLAALSETGVGAGDTVLIGDTTFDMDMGRAAGVRTIGVGWGYHPAESLQADAIARTAADLPGLIAEVLEHAR